MKLPILLTDKQLFDYILMFYMNLNFNYIASSSHRSIRAKRMREEMKIEQLIIRFVFCRVESSFFAFGLFSSSLVLSIVSKAPLSGRRNLIKINWETTFYARLYDYTVYCVPFLSFVVCLRTLKIPMEINWTKEIN